MIKDTDGIYVHEETYYAVFENEIMSHFYEKKKNCDYNTNNETQQFFRVKMKLNRTCIETKVLHEKKRCLFNLSQNLILK